MCFQRAYFFAGSACFSSLAGAAGAATAGSACFSSPFTSPPQPQLEPSLPQLEQPQLLSWPQPQLEPQLEQPQLLPQPQLWQPQDWQPPQLPQCEKRRLRQPPKQPPWLPQTVSQPQLEQPQLEPQLLQPPQLPPLPPNQKALAVHGTANTATIKAIR